MRIYREDVLKVAAEIAGNMMAREYVAPSTVGTAASGIVDAAEAIVKEVYTRFSEAGVKDI